MSKIIKLPELGENIAGGDVIKILVKVGDEIHPNQPIVEIETDKAAIEVPSPESGKVEAIHIKVGDKAKVGQTIISLIGNGSTKSSATSTAEVIKPATQIPNTQAFPSKPTVPVANAKALLLGSAIPASPSIRRKARELGIDLTKVIGTGLDGRIRPNDLSAPTLSLPDFSRYGDIEKFPLTNVRRVTAENLSKSWPVVPQVTHYDSCDITELELIRKRITESTKAGQVKVTVTAILLKVVAETLKAMPQFNASIDLRSQQIIQKKYVHIGVAVDTERGLLVPVVRNVDQKNIATLAKELHEYAEKTRNKKIHPDEMQGGNFTISNLGGIGGTNFSPIVNFPEAAILGVSRALFTPKYIDGNFVPRLMLPLALSYDHRLIDGADAARFLRAIIKLLEHPAQLVLD